MRRLLVVLLIASAAVPSMAQSNVFRSPLNAPLFYAVGSEDQVARVLVVEQASSDSSLAILTAEQAVSTRFVATNWDRIMIGDDESARKASLMEVVATHLLRRLAQPPFSEHPLDGRSAATVAMSPPSSRSASATAGAARPAEISFQSI